MVIYGYDGINEIDGWKKFESADRPKKRENVRICRRHHVRERLCYAAACVAIESTSICETESVGPSNNTNRPIALKVKLQDQMSSTFNQV